ncbi:MAG: hypothetical protein ABWY14_06530 [Tardiphaga sp.]
MVKDADKLRMRGRATFAEGLDRIRLGQPVKPRKQANALTAGKLGLGRAPSEEKAIQFTITNEHVEFVRRDVDKEQHHQPDLYQQKVRPGEVGDEVSREIGDRPAGDEKMDEPFGEPHDQYAQPVDRTFEQDGWISGAPSKRRMKGMLSVTRTAFPTSKAAAVAVRKPPNSIPCSSRIWRLVHKMRLKPTKKKIVGGSTCFTCVSHQSKARRQNGTGAETATADWLIRYPLPGSSQAIV